jgi:hypothetical protein
VNVHRLATSRPDRWIEYWSGASAGAWAVRITDANGDQIGSASDAITLREAILEVDRCQREIAQSGESG